MNGFTVALALLLLNNNLRLWWKVNGRCTVTATGTTQQHMFVHDFMNGCANRLLSRTSLNSISHSSGKLFQSRHAEKLRAEFHALQTFGWDEGEAGILVIQRNEYSWSSSTIYSCAKWHVFDGRRAGIVRLAVIEHFREMVLIDYATWSSIHSCIGAEPMNEEEWAIFLRRLARQVGVPRWKQVHEVAINHGAMVSDANEMEEPMREYEYESILVHPSDHWAVSRHPLIDCVRTEWMNGKSQRRDANWKVRRYLLLDTRILW